jgi:HK97 gp10 family phage protein
MSVTFKVEGFKELDAELAKLGSPSARRASGRRSLRRAAEPLAELAQSLAPKGDTNTLAPSITVGTKLSKRQSRMHRKMFRDDRSAVEMFVGAGPYSSAWNQEFGNRNHAAQPYLRPAWDQDKNAMLERLKKELWADIQKSLARAERRAARLAVRG